MKTFEFWNRHSDEETDLSSVSLLNPETDPSEWELISTRNKCQMHFIYLQNKRRKAQREGAEKARETAQRSEKVKSLKEEIGG